MTNILLTNFHPGNGGGHTTYIKSIVNQFKDSEFKFIIAAPKKSLIFKSLKQNYPERVFDIDFPSKIREIIGILRNIQRFNYIINKYAIDIVHVNGSPDHKIAAACKLLFRRNYKIVRTKHDSIQIKNNFFSKKIFSKYTDSLIVVSNFQMKNIVPDYLKQKTSVIHNGIDTSFFSPMLKNKKLCNELNISNKDIVLVSVAGTAYHKGWHLLVRALSEVTTKINFKIILVGNAPNERMMQDCVESISMNKSVHFLPYSNDVREIIALGDIGFVLSTNIETISYACREMMSMGKPVLVSDYAGLKENVEHKINGWVTTAGSLEDLRAFLLSFNPEVLEEMSLNAREKACKDFGIKKFLDKTALIYKNLL